ncbi:ATP-dependent DNA helicase RecG [Xylanibacillus composti]|uniref:ATP-dependent DNA helicase RecG n=1 Tax=Xylanibacillus composti TaxID=1572762 RepID=A0A8J4M1N6_9BACL|nr:ATP-dependent DNA helicase RecG [Xylanibacillus composti]MDT9725608.1 ATP-dependent DNA helicase RecG [Xylanibacillus composti]GIQ67701.1 ATP-dependent DNA helicase RecG [Xylanibacillus composti]
MSEATQSDLHRLPVRLVPGVGPQKAEHLAALGIGTVGDLLEYFPFRYEDYRLKPLEEARDGEKITVAASVFAEPTLQRYGRNKTRMTCRMLVDRVLITTVWFNRHFLRDRLTPGTDIVVTGKWDARRLQLTVSQAEFAGAQQSARSGTLQPVYSVGGEVTQGWLRKVILAALDRFGEQVAEVLPEELLGKHKLLSRKEAIRIVHRPQDGEEGRVQEGKRRMAYEELFYFQLKLLAYKQLVKQRTEGSAKQLDREKVRGFVRGLPFRLTSAQKQVIADILDDLESPHCMNRLLQGDVGSGKTVVAATALFAVVTAGYQGALMAPTEILAEQHARSLARLFEPYGLQIGLLTGSMTERQKREILSALQMGLIDIAIGTHALIQDNVYYRNLGLVVTDEQHRFGVQQRSILRRKGLAPDVLTMTATPIPRTLAITAFGDMDVSSLREMPKGRKPIQTFWVKKDKLERVWGFIRKEVDAGRQAYVICPLIEESEKLDVQNAIDLHAQLSVYFADQAVGLLHGRLPSDEKDRVMQLFHQGECAILVSTTVIEVGVDVPNATVMVIYDADRFGLSQLHQLRGRVGRGEHASTCILVADPKSESGRERMQAMTETTDGFEIARRDLEMRGPGDFFGTKQSGLPEFRFSDIVQDYELLEQAREDAASLVRSKMFWTDAAYAGLRDYLRREQIFQGDLLD